MRLEAGEGGLEQAGYVLCHDPFTFDRDRFRRHSGTLTSPKLLEAEALYGVLSISSPRKTPANCGGGSDPAPADRFDQRRR